MYCFGSISGGHVYSFPHSGCCAILIRCRGDDGVQPLFSSVRKTEIGHEDIDEREGERSLKKQQPDRVIGLNLTKTIAERISSDRFRTNTHTPFLGKNVFYPFLMLEAKREKGLGPGFTSIEHQTAFPIRTCLRLQQNLRQETGIDFRCLVWFFAFRGEEWRLYGAVPDRDKTVRVPPNESSAVPVTNKQSVHFRSMAWYHPLRGWCSPAVPHRGLYLPLGAQQLPRGNTCLFGCG